MTSDLISFTGLSGSFLYDPELDDVLCHCSLCEGAVERQEPPPLVKEDQKPLPNGRQRRLELALSKKEGAKQEKNIRREKRRMKSGW